MFKSKDVTAMPELIRPVYKLKDLKYMADDKNLDLNAGDGKASAGAGQPENKTAATDTGVDEIDKEIGTILGDEKDAEIDVDLGDEEDETVVLDRKTAEKLLRDRNNYRKGLVSIKDRLKIPKKGGETKETKAGEGAGDKGNGDGQQGQPQEGKPKEGEAKKPTATEKEAIDKACEDPIVNDNWSELIKYYKPHNGKTSVDNILKDIRIAKAAMLEANPELAKTGDGEDKSSSADLAADKGKPGSGSQGKGQNQERKSVIPKRTPVKDWYGDQK